MGNSNRREVNTGILAHRYILELYGSMGNEDSYYEWLKVFREASDLDIIIIYINSNGGQLFPAMQLALAIHQCEAHVQCVIDVNCASAATLVFLAGDSFVVNDHARFMAHNYSGGVYGKAGELFSQLDNDKKWNENFIRQTYKDFLTDEEVNKLLTDRDIHLDAEETRLRCEKLIQIREGKDGAK